VGREAEEAEEGGIMYSRVLLDVALGPRMDQQFKVVLSCTEASKLEDPDVLRHAVHRLKEYMVEVLEPEAKLRERWRTEDEAERLKGQEAA
jgi:hypothetical protein